MQEFDHKPIVGKPSIELERMFELLKADSYTRTTSDFDKINNLILDLINLEYDLNREWKTNEKNYEDCKTKAWIFYKDLKRKGDGKPVSEKQADYLAKNQANKRYLDSQAETDFWFAKSMLKFIESKLVQMGITNKDQRILENNLK